MPGIDTQIDQRMALGPQALQQRYAQTQQLVDLLALQKLSKDKADAARAIQASMQNNPATVKDQLEQQLMGAQREEVTNEMSRGIASMLPGVQQQGRQMAQQRRPMPQQTPQQRPPMPQQRPAMPQQMPQQMPQGQGGIPQLASPNIARLAGGGIVSFQEGGDVDAANEYIRLSEKLKDPNISPEAAQAINMMLEDMKRQAQDESRFMLEIERARGFDPAAEYEQSMQSQGGMYGGGIVGYAPGGFVELDDELPIISIGSDGTVSMVGSGNTPTNSQNAPIQIDPETGTPITSGVGGDVGRIDISPEEPRGGGAGRFRMAGRGRTTNDPVFSGSGAGRLQMADRGRTTNDPVFSDSAEGRLQMAARGAVPNKKEILAEEISKFEMSDAELEEILKMMEDPGPIREETADDEGKREIDMDALTTFLLGMGGATSVAGALGGGGRAVEAEEQRLAELAREESQFARTLQIDKDEIAAAMDRAMLTYDSNVQKLGQDRREAIQKALQDNVNYQMNVAELQSRLNDNEITRIQYDQSMANLIDQITESTPFSGVAEPTPFDVDTTATTIDGVDTTATTIDGVDTTATIPRPSANSALNMFGGAKR
jgi:hypothetical protein